MFYVIILFIFSFSNLCSYTVFSQVPGAMLAGWSKAICFQVYMLSLHLDILNSSKYANSVFKRWNLEIIKVNQSLIIPNA